MRQKLYCYVDETGQDTRGKIFLVSVVIPGKKEKEQLEDKLLQIEKRSGKKSARWGSTRIESKRKYLSEIFSLKILQGDIFYGVFKDTHEYVALTTYTIAQAISLKTQKQYQTTIIIDGLNKKERERVMRGLKTLQIRYRKIRGLKEQASPILRLADAIAGFLRDYIEGQKYAQEIHSKHKVTEYIQEIKK